MVWLNVHLIVIHVWSTFLKNIVWKTLEEDTISAVLPKRVLESISCDNKRTLRRHAENIMENDTTRKLQSPTKRIKKMRREISWLCQEIRFPITQGTLMKMNQMTKRNALRLEMTHRILYKRNLTHVCRRLTKDGLSPKGGNNLKAQLHRFREIFKICLRIGGLPKLAPLKIDLNPGTKPIKVGIKRYPVGQRTFFKSFIQQIVHSELLIPILSLHRSGPTFGSQKFIIDALHNTYRPQACYAVTKRDLAYAKIWKLNWRILWAARVLQLWIFNAY